jgi:proteasome lid subunit RPN8/RPN11
MIRLSRAHYEAIVAHARQEAPRECCGLLAGKGERVELVYPIANRADQAVDLFAERALLPRAGADPAALPTERYFMDPEELFRALREIEAQALEHLANYHSHPATPARPSRTDIEFAAYWPHVYHLICSLADPGRPDLRAFRIVDGEATEVPIMVEDE